MSTPERLVPSGSSRRARAQQAVQLVVAGLGIVLALVFAALWGLGAQDLDESRSQMVDLTGQVEDLEDEVQAGEAELQEIQRQLAASEERAKAGLADVEGKEADLAAREQVLSEREQALADREQKLEDREDVASREAAVTDESDVGELSAPDDSLGSAAAEFDRAWLLSKANNAIGDIRRIDRYMLDGIGASTALSMLSDSYGRMADAGVPPGLDAANYMARLDTLQTFAVDAARLYDQDPMQATAKYDVLRGQTEVLFEQINRALGADLQLP